MHPTTSDNKYTSSFKSHTVFLTGGTGGLGTCVLAKLCLELPTKKIFVLVRSKEKALKTWKAFIPDQIDAIINSGKVVLVVGDIGKINLGIERSTLSQIASETTIVINSAANTSFSTTTSQAVKDNCFSALEVAKVASAFPHLAHFTQVSTTYCNAFLPDGPVTEAIHPFYNPEAELTTILATGTSPNAPKFPWPYAHSKHLSEQLLMARFPSLPLLIVRPSCIGSAVRSPYAGYGPLKSTPIEMFWRVHALNSHDGSVFWTPKTKGAKSGTNHFDEVPVDWVANLILLHAAANTRGVVHASSGTFVSRTFDFSRDLYKGENDREIEWTSDRSRKQCLAPDFYKVTNGDWRFETSRSEWCKTVEGALSVSVGNEELCAYDLLRRTKVRRDIDGALARAGKMAMVKLRERVEAKERSLVRDGVGKRESRL